MDKFGGFVIKETAVTAPLDALEVKSIAETAASDRLELEDELA